MTHLDAALARVGAYADPSDFDKLRRHLDLAAITEALTATMAHSQRERRFPMPQVVWLVVAMALFRDLPIEVLVPRLRLARPSHGNLRVAPSVVPQARQRLGAQPLQRLFEAVASAQAHTQAGCAAQRWRDLALYGVDGSSVRVPDSAENRAYFGPSVTGRGRGESGYPLVRLVALMALRSHLLAGVRFGPFATGEIGLAQSLWSQVPDDSLTIIDRNFLGAAVLLGLSHHGTRRHWLIRLKSNSRWRVLRKLGPGDWLVELTVSPEARRKDPSLPAVYRARVLHYQRKGFRPQKLLTSLLDPDTYPSAEIVQLYHVRWELELGLAEIKTTMLDRRETLRSKTSMGVQQELWGLMLAYHLVRMEMQQAAEDVGVVPTRISFVTMLRRLRDAWFVWVLLGTDNLSPAAQQFLESLGGLILRERRPQRCYERAVKIKMSNYKRKRPVTTLKAA
jgi:hypothetical protein